MKERRKYERFALSLPIEVEVLGSNKQQLLNLLTKDVSAGGAFFYVGESVSEGVQVKVRMIVASQALKEMTGAQGLVKVAEPWCDATQEA